MTKETLLVTLADRNYIDQAKQLFSSVYWNAGWKGDYMLLAHDIPDKDLEWFRDKGILVKKCRPLYDKEIGKDNHPGVVVTKFYLFTPFFRKWRNIVYLDTDIIVRASLDELAKVKGFSAVPDVYLNKLGKQLMNKESKAFSQIRTEYDLNRPSFNAGVLVFSTDIIEEDTYERLNALFRKHIRLFGYGEQTALNLYFHNMWKRLPLVYNVCLEGFEFCYNETPKDGIVFHFSGANELDKPWNSHTRSYREWKENLDRAELIDLSSIPEGRKWSRFRVMTYPALMKSRRLVRLSYMNVDRSIGKFGIFLKKRNPELYHKLKKAETGLRRIRT